jgi:hypothetical protein
VENNSNELNDIVGKLQQQGKMNFAPKASDVLIRAFEVRNGVTLPEKYKEWLLFSDGGDCFLPAGVQLYGVAHKPLIDANDNDRPNANYIVIGALASGDPILCEKSGERISIYNHEAGKIEDDETFTDFLDFLNNLGETLGIGG